MEGDYPWGLWECGGQGAGEDSKEAYAQCGRQRAACWSVHFGRAEFSVTLGFMEKVGPKRGEEEIEQSPPSDCLDRGLAQVGFLGTDCYLSWEGRQLTTGNGGAGSLEQVLKSLARR